jgi:hypothetical protein
MVQGNLTASFLQIGVAWRKGVGVRTGLVELWLMQISVESLSGMPADPCQHIEFHFSSVPYKKYITAPYFLFFRMVLPAVLPPHLAGTVF